MDVPFFLGELEGGDGGGGGAPPSGTIDIEPGVWQLVSVPSVYGYWQAGAPGALVFDGGVRARFKNYVLDQLAEKYADSQQFIDPSVPYPVRVAGAYPGDLDAFLTYNPGVTPDAAPQNFELCYEEEDNSFEPAGFWLKSNYALPMTLEWTAWL